MIAVITAVVTFLILDGLWLGVVGTRFYLEGFGHMMTVQDGKIQPYWPAAILVYVALMAGVLLCVVPKAQGQIGLALMWGACYGFVTYATYDFTNLSVLANWPLKISIIDTCWGMVLCAATSAMTVWVSQLSHAPS